jgi:hypothetical protein
MNATTRKVILTALVCLATGSALADDSRVFSGRTLGPVAELSQEERAWLRERWQRLPANERDSLRRELRDTWDEVPPEARQQRRKLLKERLEEHRDRRHQSEDNNRHDDGYGRGYGSRPNEYDDRRDGRR